MGNPLGRFIGKVPSIFGITLILVFFTFLLAKILGESGTVFFEVCWILLTTEIIIVPAVGSIFLLTGLNVLMPLVILPLLEFITGLVVGAINGGITLINIPVDWLGQPISPITNPFIGVADRWVPLDEFGIANFLMTIFDRMKAVLDAI